MMQRSGSSHIQPEPAVPSVSQFLLMRQPDKRACVYAVALPAIRMARVMHVQQWEVVKRKTM